VSTSKVAASDVEPNRRRGGEIRVVLGPATVGATTGFLGSLTLKPDEFVSEHYHPYSEEFLFVVSGEIVVRIDGEPVTASAGEGVFVPKNARHRVENPFDAPAEVVFHLCPLAPRPELGHVDTENVPEPALPNVTVEGVR
jgi:putative monooxygenase